MYTLLAVPGYVQTPRWDPTGRVFYPPDMDSNVTVTVPANHVALVSLVHSDIRMRKKTTYNEFFGTLPLKSNDCLDKLEVSSIQYKPSRELRQVWKVCGNLKPKLQTLRRAQAVHVYFRSYTTQALLAGLEKERAGLSHIEGKHTGFRLLFSFIKV